MPEGNLRRMVRQADRQRARHSRVEPERLIMAPVSDAQTRRICFDCRQVAEPVNLLNAWYAGGGTCPSCGGRLVEVSG